MSTISVSAQSAYEVVQDGKRILSTLNPQNAVACLSRLGVAGETVLEAAKKATGGRVTFNTTPLEE